MHKELGGNIVKSNKTVKIIVFMAILLPAILIMAVMTGATKETVAKSDSVKLPIIMYHSLLKDEKLQNDYTISPTLFENDLKYLTENGYTTVVVKDLTDYVYGKKSLPEKCIMLTFDDGYYNNYYYALPLLEKYNCKAVISPIASVSEKFTETKDISVTYGHITFDDIKEMSDSGYVEIQNHSYDMHSLKSRKGVSQKAGESDETYKSNLTEDVTKAQTLLENATGKKPTCFVYPFGAKNDLTEKLIKEMGFSCTLTCTEKPNIITKNPDSLYELGRYRRDRNESMQNLLIRIDTQL